MKYIVYATINCKNNKFYIGVHGTENPDVFDGYIGNGIFITQPSSYKKSKTAFQYAVNKYGTSAFKRITLKVFDTEEEAYEFESIIVTEEFVKNKNNYNMTTGGRKGPDQSVTVYQYDTEGNFVKEWKSLRAAAKNFEVTDTAIKNAAELKSPSCGFYWSTTKYDKLPLKEYVRTNFKSKDEIPEVKVTSTSRVYVYDLDGNFVTEYDNPIACRNAMGMKNTNAIYKAMRLGWECNGYQMSAEKLPFMKKIRKCNGQMRIDRYDLDGNYIETYKSLAEAQRQYGVNVLKCIRGQRETCKGFIFKVRS